jgi:hypothetical protein
MRLDLLDRLHVDQWPDHRARLDAVGDLHRPWALGQPLRERVMDARPAPKFYWYIHSLLS